MPRKSVPRAFKLLCKHYKGFDRHFTAKAIATRKFHSQGFIVNQKLAAAPDSKHGSKSAPLVRTYAAVYPSFAAQPLATRTAGQLARHPHSAACSPHAKLTAPSFAAAPVWRARASADAVPAGSSSAQCNMASQPVKATAASSPELGSNPVYQYATMGQQAAAGQAHPRRLTHKQEKNALKWYGRLDQRPIHKASVPHAKQARSDQARMAAAFVAYADLPKS